jgi:hypothetical protein
MVGPAAPGLCESLLIPHLVSALSFVRFDLLSALVPAFVLLMPALLMVVLLADEPFLPWTRPGNVSRADGSGRARAGSAGRRCRSR